MMRVRSCTDDAATTIPNDDLRVELDLLTVRLSSRMREQPAEIKMLRLRQSSDQVMILRRMSTMIRPLTRHTGTVSRRVTCTTVLRFALAAILSASALAGATTDSTRKLVVVARGIRKMNRLPGPALTAGKCTGERTAHLLVAIARCSRAETSSTMKPPLNRRRHRNYDMFG